MQQGEWQICDQPSSTHPLLLVFPPTGTLPNITRNAIVNCGELVTYDLIKEALIKYHVMTGEDCLGLGVSQVIPGLGHSPDKRAFTRGELPEPSLTCHCM